MKTKLLAFCFSLCFCLAAASISAAVFTSPHGYSLTLPPGWRINPHHDAEDDVVIEFRQNISASETMPNLQVDVTPLEDNDDTTLESLRSVLVADYLRSVPGTVVKSQSYSSIGGVRDLDLVFTQPGKRTVSRLRQVFVLRNKKVYFFTAAYPERTHTKYDAMIAQMLSSVRWN